MRVREDPGIRWTLARFADRDVADDRRESRHETEGPWAITRLGPAPWGCEWVIFVHPLICLAQDRAPVELPLALVSHKVMGPGRASDARYLAADVRHPCLVVEGLENPHGRPYRMIDGKHRIHRLLDAGRHRGMFHVFQWVEVLPYVHFVPRKDRRSSGV